MQRFVNYGRPLLPESFTASRGVGIAARSATSILGRVRGLPSHQRDG